MVGNNGKNNGRFTPGHTLSQGSRAPGGGRKKTLVSEERDALDADRDYLPQYLAKLRELALEGNLEALKEQISRHLGRPHQSQDMRIKAEIGRSPEELKLAAMELIEAARASQALITEPAIEGEVIDGTVAKETEGIG